LVLGLKLTLCLRHRYVSSGCDSSAAAYATPRTSIPRLDQRSRGSLEPCSRVSCALPPLASLLSRALPAPPPEGREVRARRGTQAPTGRASPSQWRQHRLGAGRAAMAAAAEHTRKRSTRRVPSFNERASSVFQVPISGGPHCRAEELLPLTARRTRTAAIV
jgi:hypothetical protein